MQRAFDCALPRTIESAPMIFPRWLAVSGSTNSLAISRAGHAKIIAADGRAVLEDLGGKNGSVRSGP